jgi:peptidoglycan/LPS O-acetylase OafA/YrhL
MAHKKHIYPLTSIRFFAALSVMVAHFGTSIYNGKGGYLEPLLHNGGDAVKLFFVLSGFILSYTYWDRPLETKESRTQFAWSRFARIAPLYYFSLALGFINLCLKGADEFSFLHIFWSVVAKLLFIHSLVPQVVFDPSWAVATWSLSVEAFFYTLMPFCWKKMRLIGERQLPNHILLSICSMGLIGFILEQLTVQQFGPRIWYVNPVSYLGFFWIGFVICYLYKNLESRLKMYSSRMVFLGVAGIIAGRLLHGENLATQQLVTGSASALLIAGLATSTGLINHVMSNKVLVLLGEASYALYLLHGPVHSVVSIILEKLKLPSIGVSVPIFGIYCVISVLISILAFKWVEIPSRNLIMNAYTTRLKQKNAGEI